jgi:1-acyl-sn-glycerol-3-phosphate acyltransferase
MRLSPTYNVIGALSTPVLRGIFRLRVEGLENVPASGGCVLASNHLSSFDPWPLGVPLWPRRQLRVMAKSELYWFPLSVVIRGAGAFPVRRGQRDTVAIETGVQLAREGNIVAMFPEGTRRHKGLVKRFEARPHSGAARIALEADVPLIPAAVKGTDRLLRLARLHVAYGAPVDLDDLRGQEVGAVATEATTRLMARIAELEASL